MTFEEYLNNLKIEKNLHDELTRLINFRNYKAGETILNMGENTKVVCLILKGIVRGYYLDENGNDITKCFSKESEWCCFYNFLKNEPSTFYVQALEDCYLAEINVNSLKMAIEKYPSLQKNYTKLTQEAFIKVEEKGASFQKMNAKERYLSFIENNQDIANRVKQEYIASYLGITPSSLSRIKKDL